MTTAETNEKSIQVDGLPVEATEKVTQPDYIPPPLHPTVGAQTFCLPLDKERCRFGDNGKAVFVLERQAVLEMWGMLHALNDACRPDPQPDRGDHTPGPWEVRDQHPKRSCLTIAPRGSYCEIATLFNAPEPNGSGYSEGRMDDDGIWRDDHVRKANARLIASAPTLAAENAELREALKECAAWLESRPDYTEGDAATASMARALLSRTKGETL